MIREISEEKVRKTRECKGSKSLGLDGVNFEIIKEFWMNIIYDFMRVMKEFHPNGWLVK